MAETVVLYGGRNGHIHVGRRSRNLCRRENIAPKGAGPDVLSEHVSRIGVIYLAQHVRALDLRDSLGRVSPSGRDSLRWPGACAPPRASILPVRLPLIKPDWTDRKPDLLFSHALRGLAGLRTATRPSFHDMKSQLCALEFLLNHRYEQAWRLSTHSCCY